MINCLLKIFVHNYSAQPIYYTCVCRCCEPLTDSTRCNCFLNHNILDHLWYMNDNPTSMCPQPWPFDSSRSVGQCTTKTRFTGVTGLEWSLLLLRQTPDWPWKRQGHEHQACREAQDTPVSSLPRHKVSRVIWNDDTIVTMSTNNSSTTISYFFQEMMDYH